MPEARPRILLPLIVSGLAAAVLLRCGLSNDGFAAQNANDGASLSIRPYQRPADAGTSATEVGEPDVESATDRASAAAN
jgi:hypothetical protein